MKRAFNVIGGFIEDRCIIDGYSSETSANLYTEYSEWAETMTKSDLIGELSRVRGITLKQAEIVVNSTFEIMTESLTNDGQIEIRGFAAFKVKKYQGYEGRNPKTGKVIEVEPKKLPVFKRGNY